MRRATLLSLLPQMVTAVGIHAQSLTPDPAAWRPMSYANLQGPTPDTATYAEIWKDEIDKNNQLYRESGDRRFLGGNAPATEAHFVIWSRARSVVVSLLNTASGCVMKQGNRDAAARVKLCPMRVAIYEGVRVRTLDAGRGCFLEPAPGATLDPSASAPYASYDVATKTVKIGMLVAHQAVDGCSNSIPLAEHLP
ncbi:hypothetical protein [Ancylobacter dichloromethanicus]|uniref:hypothetical protein n=1 Tax=Ancylobacter dichloromethanicus TaxID=518825 RepID=UPI00360723C7